MHNKSPSAYLGAEVLPLLILVHGGSMPLQYAKVRACWLQCICMQFTQACRSSCCLPPFCTDASWRCDKADLCNEAAVVVVTTGQQHIQAGQVSMQDVHAMQMGHAACYLPNRCQNRRQVWQAMQGRPVGAEPASVNAILPKQKATSSISGMPCFV